MIVGQSESGGLVFGWFFLATKEAYRQEDEPRGSGMCQRDWTPTLAPHVFEDVRICHDQSSQIELVSLVMDLAKEVLTLSTRSLDHDTYPRGKEANSQCKAS